MDFSSRDDLGFTFRQSKSGDVVINHNGRHAGKLRGEKAAAFVEQINSRDFAQQQQLMARITGHYKHGNERQAKNHPRNRRD